MNARCILMVLVFVAISCPAAAENKRTSRDIGCMKVLAGRAQEICTTLAENMEWEWMGHAIFSPGYRTTFIGLKKTYCALGITEKDLPILDALAGDSAEDWRLVQGAADLAMLQRNLDGKGSEPKNSVFNPENSEYILKDGCDQKAGTVK